MARSESVRHFVGPIDGERKADEWSTIEQIVEFEYSAFTEWQFTIEQNVDPSVVIASGPLMLLDW